MTSIGSLSDRQIKDLIKKENIFDKNALNFTEVGPASIDISSSSEMYRIDKNIIPKPNQKIRDLLKEIGAVKHDIKNPLEKEVQYICYIGKINLPKNVYAYGNAKSSSGRVDLHVRLLADHVHTYDTLTTGEKDFWLHITPHSFPVICPEKTALLQVRLFNGDARLKVTEVKDLNQTQKKNDKCFSYTKQNIINDKISWEKYSDEKGHDILLSLNIPNKGVVGYKAKKTNKVLDLSKRDYNSEDFFEPIYSDNGKLDLTKNDFYILSTRESINIPENLAGEMVANDTRLGEFRTHYAGFFDPGFAGEGVLEVRPQEDISFWHGQPMVPFRLEKMCEIPEKSYKIGHNYYGQKGPKLAKFFKQK
jgi:dCTP deaminase